MDVKAKYLLLDIELLDMRHSWEGQFVGLMDALHPLPRCCSKIISEYFTLSVKMEIFPCIYTVTQRNHEVFNIKRL